jgi:flagellar hook-associated protein 1 FlgK
MMSTGVSGLMAFQTALDTTSHNISNANTVGYSRQSATLVTASANYSGSGWIGTGVSVSTITRTYDDLVAAQVRSSSSGMQQWDIYSSLADQVNNLFGDAARLVQHPARILQRLPECRQLTQFQLRATGAAVPG